jgi:hypothetical protein
MLNSGESTTTYKLDRCVMKSLNFLNLIAQAVPLWWVLTSGSVIDERKFILKKNISWENPISLLSTFGLRPPASRQ